MSSTAFKLPKLDPFPIVGFHTKIQTTKLSILPRFYCHGLLQQLKTNFQTNFRSKRFLGFVIEYA